MHIDGGLLVEVAGELDVVTALAFRDRMNGHLSLAAVGDVEFDLGQLTFLDVTGLRALLEVRDRVAMVGGRLVVRALDRSRLPVAAVLGLDQSLTVLPPGRGGGGSPGQQG